MESNYYNPLSDMSRIKRSLMSLFCDTVDITRLIMPELEDSDFTWEQNWYGGTFTKSGQSAPATLPGHCFDTPFIEGALTNQKSAIFMESYLTKMESQRIREVGITIYLVCHKDSIGLSEEDRAYYESIGIYGNRVDSALQAINAAIQKPTTMDSIRKNYSIGNLIFAEEEPIKPYLPGTDYYGKSLSYTYPAFYRKKDSMR